MNKHEPACVVQAVHVVEVPISYDASSRRLQVWPSCDVLTCVHPVRRSAHFHPASGSTVMHAADGARHVSTAGEGAEEAAGNGPQVAGSGEAASSDTHVCGRQGCLLPRPQQRAVCFCDQAKCQARFVLFFCYIWFRHL